MAFVSLDMSFLREEVTRLNSNMTEFNSRLTSAEERISALESQDAANQSQAEERSKAEISRLRMEFNEREQNHFAMDLELACVAEKPGENTLNIVIPCARKVGLDLTEQDIVSAERSGQRRFAAADGERVRPRPVVVRLTRRSLHDELLRAARVRRGVDTSGIIDGELRRYYFNERLTPLNRYLFFKTREEGRKKVRRVEHHIFQDIVYATNRALLKCVAVVVVWAITLGEE
ncbi:uncharacterized protein LOC125075612 [Vanessa atalanta]|uniref:uncharacterized protein LOC125075612 n=1 Tax=Vanessa atalanta TaxID=42275 RepID=UPI001FCD4142|nr:uncharacterized protein LOC125075612 [Vanessa atalanta]